MRTQAAPAAGERKRAITGWILYDLANTIFALNITSFYFSLWVVKDLGATDANFGVTTSISMAAVFLTAPIIGALSDQTRRRMPFLVVTTVICVAVTTQLGVRSALGALVLFAVANYFYQTGLIFYDALLPVVSTEENRGRIGGLGVGIGYMGSFIGLGTGFALTAALGVVEAKPVIFKATAALFLLFALPCFFWVKEPPKKVGRFGFPTLGRALQELRGAARLTANYPGLRRFLVGRVFYTDAANTLGVYMTIYVTQEIGFTEHQAGLVLVSGIAAAMVGAPLWGLMVDRIGPRRTLHRVLAVWAVTLTLGFAIAQFDMPGGMFWIVAPLGGLALGGTWAADRPYMLRLTPPRYLGLFYGFYNMVGRFSAILGPLIWALIVNVLDLGRPVAVASLIVMIGISYLILRPLSDAPRQWAEADLPATEPS